MIWENRIFFLTAIKTDKVGSASIVVDCNVGPLAGERNKPFHGGQAPRNIYRFDIVCMDRKTGDILWKQHREETGSWATPIVVEVGRRYQVIVSARDRIRSYDLERGQLIWYTPYVPSPLLYGEKLYVCFQSGAGGGSHRIFDGGTV